MAKVEGEFRGHGGVVRIDGDELVWTAGGRLRRGMDRAAVLDQSSWRIPIAAIREVVFKDSGLTAGHLHLVLGDAETPKNTQWSVMGQQWTILFQPGKQAKAFRELHGILERAVAFNRQTGVDPTKSRGPYLATEKPGLREDLADTVVRQPSPDVPPSELIALAKERPKVFSQSWSDLDSLHVRLEPAEPIRLLTIGIIGVRSVLLALTDRRVLVHHDNQLGTGSEELRLPAIESVTWKSGGIVGLLAPSEAIGTVTFRATGFAIEVKVHEPAARAFIEGVKREQHAAAPRSVPRAAVMDQLSKLGELRDAGVLTEAEFNAKKTELFDRL